MKRKLASVLVSLTFGWLATTAIADDEKAEASADSSTSMSEPAAVTEESTDSAAIDSSTNDGTIAATPAETEADKK